MLIESQPASDPQRPATSRAKTISVTLAMLLAAGLLYYSLRGIQWPQVWSLVTRAKPTYLGLGCSITTVSLFLRAIRWRILLTAEGAVSVRDAFWATSAGYFGNNFLPARAGELVRTFMVSARTGLNKAYVLATALSERVADAIALVVISSLVLLTLPAQPGWLATAAKPFAILGLGGVLAIALLPRLEWLGRRILERVPLPHGLRNKLLGVMEAGLRGIRAFHDPRRLFGFLGLTILIWCLDAVATVIGAAALGLVMPLPVAFLLIAGLGLGSALPSTPGYIGIWQFVAVSILTPFGFSKTDAVAYILVAQALQYFVVGLFGAGGLLYYRRMKDSNDTSQGAPLGDRLESWAQRIDRRPLVVLAFLAVIYAVLVAPSVKSHLWFDELNTYYIAQAPSAAQMIEEIKLLDLNPPLMYVLVRASMDLFGHAEFGARLPVMLGFFAASAGMFWFVSKRAGVLWAAASVGLFWYSPYFMYAMEARPYGLLLGFLGLTLVSWDSAVAGTHRAWALAGVAVGATAMMLTHVYGILWIMPFCAAELVRLGRTRRPDWPLWAALIFPTITVLTYIPLVRNAAGGVFPLDYQGSIEKAYLFYLSIFVSVYLPMIIACALAFGTVVWRKDTSPKVAGFAPHELVLFVTALLPPALLNLVAMQRHMAFYPRHAVATVLMADLLLVLVLAYESKVNRLAGLAAAIVMGGFLLVPAVRGLTQHVPPSFASQVKLDGINPDVPLVANSALTFLEMDHYEDPALLKRLYYLVDHDSAIQYAHSTLTESLPALKQYFPVRANVSSYSDFAAQHRHFLVWGVTGKGDWLLKKLKAEGAGLVEIGKFDTPYTDSHLWDVTLAR